MSFRSDYPEILDCHTTETTGAHGAGLDPANASTGNRPRRRGTDDTHLGSGTRARVVSLGAEVELLEAEREALTSQVLALEADVAELEAEVRSLERTVETETQRRQRVIDRYEHVIAEKEQAHRELEEKSEAIANGADARRIRPLPAIRSSVEAVYTRLRHLVPNG